MAAPDSLTSATPGSRIIYPALQLVRELACPNAGCSRPYREADLNCGVAFPLCKACRARWWALSIGPGRVVERLAREFEDRAIAESIVDTYRFPHWLDIRHYWQISMRPRDVHAHKESSPSEMFSALHLLPSAR